MHTVFILITFLHQIIRRPADDPEVKKLLELDNDLLATFNNGLVEDIVPYLKDIYPTARWKKMVALTDQILNVFRGKLQEHKDTFKPGEDKIYFCVIYNNAKCFADMFLLFFLTVIK